MDCGILTHTLPPCYRLQSTKSGFITSGMLHLTPNPFPVILTTPASASGVSRSECGCRTSTTQVHQFPLSSFILLLQVVSTLLVLQFLQIFVERDKRRNFITPNYSHTHRDCLVQRHHLLLAGFPRRTEGFEPI